MTTIYILQLRMGPASLSSLIEFIEDKQGRNIAAKAITGMKKISLKEC